MRYVEVREHFQLDDLVGHVQERLGIHRGGRAWLLLASTIMKNGFPFSRRNAKRDEPPVAAAVRIRKNARTNERPRTTTATLRYALSATLSSVPSSASLTQPYARARARSTAITKRIRRICPDRPGRENALILRPVYDTDGDKRSARRYERSFAQLEFPYSHDLCIILTELIWFISRNHVVQLNEYKFYRIERCIFMLTKKGTKGLLRILSHKQIEIIGEYKR